MINKLENMEFKKVVFSEALILLFITIGAYWLSFKYEYNYLSFFQIPPQLIDINAILILTTTLYLSISALVLFWVLNLASTYMPEDPILKMKYRRIVCVIVIILFYIYTQDYSWNSWLIGMIILAILATLEFLVPLSYKGKSYMGKILTHEYEDGKSYSNNLFSKAYQTLGPVYYFIIFYYLFTTIFAGWLGNHEAKKQLIYPVDIQDNNIAVIRMYKDKFICIRYNPISKEITSYFLRDPDGNEYQNKSIGPLKKIEPRQ